MQTADKRPFLGQEHWRQTLAIVVPILLFLLPSLVILVNDHFQVQRNASDLTLEREARQDYEKRDDVWRGEIEKRLTRQEDKMDGVSSNEITLGTKLDVLGGSVNNLTLAVQKLTDLLPERKGRP